MQGESCRDNDYYSSAGLDGSLSRASNRYKDLETYLNTITIMTSTSQAIALPNMDFKKIRKTNEKPPGVSVIDLIAVVSDVENFRDV